MNITIWPSFLKGNLQIPGSKSAMQRAVALAMLHNGKTILSEPGISHDDKAALAIAKSLGAVITPLSDNKLEISGSKAFQPAAEIKKQEETLEINCGESGLSMRMFTSIAALYPTPVRITGSGSLLSRPMDFFVDLLPKLGVSISSKDGKAPLDLHGQLIPADIEIYGSLSSQFLTGLLIAFAKAAKEEVTIKVNNLNSKPYINLTLQLLKKFGYHVTHNNFELFTITLEEISTETIEYRVESDWSSASFLLVAAAINGNLLVTGLDKHSAQADAAILEALLNANVSIQESEEGILIEKSNIEAFDFDATDCPDLFPPLVALAAYANGTSTIKGANRLLHKESNRGLTLQTEFAKLGVQIDLEADEMKIYGTRKIKSADTESHNDHRIAMSLAVAALQADGPIIIKDAEAINKSYPDFYKDLESLGAKTKL